MWGKNASKVDLPFSNVLDKTFSISPEVRPYFRYQDASRTVKERNGK